MGFTVILLGVMIFSFVWGMIYLSESMDSVFEPSSAAANTTGFNLSGAQNLNLRGLVPH